MSEGDAEALIEAVDLSDDRLAVEIHRLQRDAYRREADLIGFDGIPPLHETLDDLRDRPLEWRVIRHGGRVVAAMGITGEGRSCDIDRLMVDGGHLRRGLARRLLASVMHHETVTVSTGTDNHPARGLYESLGFRRLGEREVAPGVTVTQYEHWDDSFRTVFDRDVAGYESARPGYPGDLFRLLAERCGVGPGSRVLEVGPGPGQATLGLLDLGAEVVAVEPGSAMAARLRERTAGRRCMVIESDFEAATLPPGAFHVGAAATSFHWVDPQVGVQRMAEALVPDGWLALWWNVFHDLHQPDDEFHREIGRIAERFQTSGRRDSVTHAFAVDARTAEIEAGGHFRLVDHVRLPFRVVHTPASMRALFASFSTWAALPEPDRSQALDEVAAIVSSRPDGTLTRTYVTALYLAQRSGT